MSNKKPQWLIDAEKAIQEFNETEWGKLTDKEFRFKQNQSNAGKIAANIVRTCPHCNKTIKGPSYFQWHGDKCKHKK